MTIEGTVVYVQSRSRWTTSRFFLSERTMPWRSVTHHPPIRLRCHSSTPWDWGMHM